MDRKKYEYVAWNKTRLSVHVYVQVHDHEAESYLALDRSAAVSWGNYTNGVNRTGWAYLEVYTNKQYEDSIQARSAPVMLITQS